MAEQALAAIPNPIKGKPTGLTAFLATLNLGELVIPLAILAIIVALITPMPALLLDFLLAIDIMLSVVVLMVSVYITKPVEFTVFPTTLLMLTLFRLALNVSSSRLIHLLSPSATSPGEETYLLTLVIRSCDCYQRLGAAAFALIMHRPSCCSAKHHRGQYRP